MSQRKDKPTALISGAGGLIGRHLAQHLHSKGWRVFAVARRALDYTCHAEQLIHVKADLGDKAQLVEALKGAGASGAGGITHVFHCALQQSVEDPVKACEVNLVMLRNAVEAAEEVGANLQHVHCNTGHKWYGEAIPGAKLKTPFKEDDPRHVVPNFYYWMQDYLEARVAGGAPWAWSSVRPNPVCGYSAGSAMNLITSLAVYGAICKELGTPLWYPGSDFGFQALTEVVDVGLMAEAMEFCATQDSCRNQAFNLSNGDTFRWSQVWPKVAAFFGLEPGFRPMQMALGEVMPSHEGLWRDVVKRHGLQDIPYDKLATWPFLDMNFSMPCDWFSDVNKLRRVGFQGQCLDSGDMLLRQLQELREQRVIP